MRNFLEACQFAWASFHAMRLHLRSGACVSSYVRSSHGIPNVMMFVATGREAWRVSQFIDDYFASRDADPTP